MQSVALFDRTARSFSRGTTDFAAVRLWEWPCREKHDDQKDSYSRPLQRRHLPMPSLVGSALIQVERTSALEPGEEVFTLRRAHRPPMPYRGGVVVVPSRGIIRHP